MGPRQWVRHHWNHSDRNRTCRLSDTYDYLIRDNVRMNELHRTLDPWYLQQMRVTTFSRSQIEYTYRNNIFFPIRVILYEMTSLWYFIAVRRLMTVPDCESSFPFQYHRLFYNLPIQLSSIQNLPVVHHELLVVGMEYQDTPGYHWPSPTYFRWFWSYRVDLQQKSYP